MTEPVVPPVTPDPVLPVPPVEPPATPPAASPDTIDALPEWAQKHIRDTRAEAATYRTKATETQTAHQATLDAIATALGLKGTDDPAAAAKTAAEERDAARADAQRQKTENAVLRMAAKHAADPESLTDSRSFMAKLEALDPAADDFAAQVDAAIKTAVETNPALKTQPVPPARSGGEVGGSIPPIGQLSRADLQGMKPDEILKAKEAGRLNTILGIT